MDGSGVLQLILQQLHLRNLYDSRRSAWIRLLGSPIRFYFMQRDKNMISVLTSWLSLNFQDNYKINLVYHMQRPESKHTTIGHNPINLWNCNNMTIRFYFNFNISCLFTCSPTSARKILLGNSNYFRPKSVQLLPTTVWPLSRPRDWFILMYKQ